MRQIEPLQSGRFSVQEPKPQLFLTGDREPLPCGWAWLDLTVQECSRPLKLLLSAWTKAETTPVELTLPALDVGRHRMLVRLPDHVAVLCLSPFDHPVEFKLGAINFAETGKLQMLASLLWRQPVPLVKLLFSARTRPLSLVKAELAGLLLPPAVTQYSQWVTLHDTLHASDVEAIRSHIETLSSKPLISIVMPVWNTELSFLQAALDSVTEQIYPNWELCVVDDASPRREIPALIREYAAHDRRIRPVFQAENGGIAVASNAGLTLAQGSFVALMDHDDVLPPHALYMVAVELESHPNTDLIYSDEDKLDIAGNRADPYFKPDWDERRFLGQNLISHLGVYRTALLRQIGGFRIGFDGSQDYDLALRAVEQTQPTKIRHIPHILYHWRIFEQAQTFSSTQHDRAIAAAREALVQHLARRGLPAEVSAATVADYHRVRWQLPDPPPLVSLIVPTRDRVDLLRQCISGLLNETDYPNLEVVIVDNESVEPATLNYFSSIGADPRVVVLPVAGKFNFSLLNNRGVAIANGEYIGFLNNDTKVIQSDWLREMVSEACRPGVGAVGAKLLYADGTIQHGGVVVGLGGVAGHTDVGSPRDAAGYFGALALTRGVSCVTAACLISPKAAFMAVGGLDAVNLQVAFNDVDYCLRLVDAGYNIVWTPYATLYHLESATRGSDLEAEKIERFNREKDHMQRKWGDKLLIDPFHSPNASLNNTMIVPAFPPRVTKPWHRFLRA